MHPYTMQEAFTKAAEHLMKQGCKAMRSRNSCGCAYRSPEGYKCAIGALIPDELYSPNMEQVSICGLLGAHGETRFVDRIAPLFVGIDPEFLNRLQIIHDNFDVPDWGSNLRELAAHYGLEVPACIAEKVV